MVDHENTTGRLIGVGVGPGDPELLTVKAVAALESADVVAYHAGPKRSSTARKIAERYIPQDCVEELLSYPVTTGTTDHPGGYAGAMAEFYTEASTRLAHHLHNGKTVVVLSLGDPMLYSSYQHLHRLLAEEFPATIIPGIPSITACADALGLPLAENDDIISVIPATCGVEKMSAVLRDTDTAVIMKLGRTFPAVRESLQATGKAERSYVVSRATMGSQTITPVLEADPDDIPYFSCVVVPSAKEGFTSESVPEPHGEVVVLGLGPGASEWTTPETLKELNEATDIVGYSTYVRRVPERAGQRRHLSDNKVEAERAAMALDMARSGRKVAVVSSGDPGVFAMAAAVLEVAQEPEWADVPVRVVPGMTAAQAVASRVGAPLGHDFGMISLSDRLKPWEVIEKRIRALASADMAFAVYNPASRSRRAQVEQLISIVAEYHPPTLPIIVARAVGSPEESVAVTTLQDFDPNVVDMRTMIIVGASTTTVYEGGPERDGQHSTRVFTSRRYGTQDPLRIFD